MPTLTELLFAPDPSDPPEAFLRQAARAGDALQIERLIAQGADPLSPTELGETALHLAARYGHAGCVQALLPFGGANLLSKPNALGGNLTPAMGAAERGNLHCLRLLAPLTDLSVRNGFGHDALALACANGHLDCALALVEMGCDPNVVHGSGSTCLALAIFRESTDLLRALMPWCDPNFRDGQGDTPLMLAASYGLVHHLAVLAPLSDLSLLDPQGRDIFGVCQDRAPQGAQSQIMQILRSAQEARELDAHAAPAPHGRVLRA